MTDVAIPTTSARAGRRGRRRLGYAMVLAAALLFAVNGSVSKLALEASEMGTLRWTELRTTGAFAGLAVGLALFAPRRLRAGRRELGLLAVYGVIGFVLVQWLYFVTISRLPIGIGLLLEFTAPVLVALWVRFAWHEPVRDRVWGALALVLVGLALVAQVWDGLTLDGVGVVAGLVAAVALAVFYVGGERLVARRDPLSVVCLAMGFATLFWALAQPWWSFPFDALETTADLPGPLGTAPVWVLTVLTITLGTIAPFVLSIGALQHLPATTVGIVATFEPVAASVVAWAWLDESLVGVQVLGGAIVLAGIVLAETSR